VGEILSRGEADALLGIVDDAPPGAISDAMPEEELGTKEPGESGTTRPEAVDLDLSGPPRLTPGEQIALRRIATSWARGMREPLTELVRSPVDVRCTEVTPTSAVRALEEICAPTWLHIVTLAPLDERGLLVVGPSLALAVVDRLLGGGQRGGGEGDEDEEEKEKDAEPAPPPEPRELSAIEEKIAARLSDRLLGGLGAAFADTVHGMRPRSVHREPEPSAATTVFAPGEPLVRIALAVEGGLRGAVTALLPVGPLREQLLRSRSRTRSCAEETDSAPAPSTVRDHLDSMRLEVTAVLSELELTVRELLSLRPNDVIALGPDTGTRARVMVEGVHKFDGDVGTRQGRLAVRVAALDGEVPCQSAKEVGRPPVQLVRRATDATEAAA